MDKMNNLISRSVLVLLGVILTAGSAMAIDNSDCYTCHSQKDMKKTLPGGEELSLFIDEKEHSVSIHGKNLCTSCHDDIKELPHQENLKPVLCSKCHRIETRVYNESDHGKAVSGGIKEAASCKSCHGEHHIILNSRDPKSPVNRKNIPQTCAKCHADEELMKKYHLSEAHPYQTYMVTVHGKAVSEKDEAYAAVCTDCHGSHALYSSTNPNSKIYRKNVPSTCSKCHENVYKTYQMSIHGKAMEAGIKDAPVCTDCHGEHTILSHEEPASTVYPTTISKTTCPRCHAAERITSKYGLPIKRLETYMESYHGLASQLGVTTVANCASCHGFHDILPSRDLNSSVNKTNLAKTCGKCHPGASAASLSKLKVHLVKGGDNRILHWIRLIYITLIISVIGTMTLHNLLDYWKKLRHSFRLSLLHKTQHIKWTFNERVQHITLTLSFIILACTGFAIKYPQSWWSFPFRLEKGPELRSLMHRLSALAFCLLCLYHLIYITFTETGRKKLKSLVPDRKDFEDVLQFIGFNLGFTKHRPHYPEFNYMEKSEYWALTWGSAIMIATGLLLTFENWTMAHFPVWLLDVSTAIHLYEAILATLAIIVWHLYWVIFDPEVYPMNWSWLTGREKK